MNKHKTKYVFMGIDPGIDNGYAIWHPQSGTFDHLKTLPFWQLIQELTQCQEAVRKLNEGLTSWPHEQWKVAVFVEDPNLIKAIYQKWHIKNDKNMRTFGRQAMNIGSNKRTAQLIIEWLDPEPEFVVIPVKPVNTKLNAQEFAKHTHCTQRCSQHARDAAMLVYGRTSIPTIYEKAQK